MTDRPGMSDAERAQAALEQLKSIRAFDLAYEMMIGLVSFGYQKMGLTGETEAVRDLDDARLSIELLRANLDVVEREHGPGRTGDLRATLAQMQLGYARAVQLAGAPSRSSAEAPPAEASAQDEPVGEAPSEPSPAAAPDVAPEAEPAGGEPAAEKPAGRKPAAKKSAPRKPAAKGPAARKAATEGTAAKKGGSKTASKGAAAKKKADAAPDEG